MNIPVKNKRVNLANCCRWISADEYFFPLGLCFHVRGCVALIHISMSQPHWITALPFYSASSVWQCRPHHKAVSDHGIMLILWRREAFCWYECIKHICTVDKLFISSVKDFNHNKQSFVSLSPISRDFQSTLKPFVCHCHCWGYVLEPLSAHMNTTVTDRGKWTLNASLVVLERIMQQH